MSQPCHKASPNTERLVCVDSDSDSSIDQSTNRGNKLRKKARFVREGQLAPPNGSSVYKKVGTLGLLARLGIID